MSKMKKLAVLTSALAIAATSTVATLSVSAEDVAMREMTTMEIVRDMGLGINLGNTFESCGSWITPGVTNYETAWGSTVITEETIQGYADAGFGVLRVPVAWSNMMSTDGNYTINADYLARVQEVIDWAIEDDMYVIVNIHWDSGWWEEFYTDKTTCMNKFTTIWTQLCDAFEDYSDKLMFESANEELGKWTGLPSKDYPLTNEINQTFVDLVRASGGNNAKRHLLIATPNTNIDMACKTGTHRFIMPTDPENRCAVSVHYYDPTPFTILGPDDTWASPQTTWGTDSDIEYMNSQFDKLKTTFIDNGVPVIVGEWGCVARWNKDEETIRNYNVTVVEAMYKAGLCPVLWDIYDRNNTTNTAYDRTTGKMTDPAMEEAFKEIVANGREPWVPGDSSSSVPDSSSSSSSAAPSSSDVNSSSSSEVTSATTTSSSKASSSSKKSGDSNPSTGAGVAATAGIVILGAALIATKKK